MAQDGPTTHMQGWRACDACGDLPLTSPADGVLTVPPERIVERSERVAELRGGADSDAVLPGLVAWDWMHRDCLPPREPQFVIDGDRLDTMPKVLARTLQLLDEPWFNDTAWEDAVRRFYDIPFD